MDYAWRSIAEYIRDPNDRRRAAQGAYQRRQYKHAATMYRTLADSGDVAASTRLAIMLAETGNKEELLGRANGGDAGAAIRLAGMLVTHNATDEAVRILTDHSDAGDRMARNALAWILHKDGKTDDALMLLSDHFEAEDPLAARMVALILITQNENTLNNVVLASREHVDEGREELVLFPEPRSERDSAFMTLESTTDLDQEI